MARPRAYTLKREPMSRRSVAQTVGTQLVRTHILRTRGAGLLQPLGDRTSAAEERCRMVSGFPVRRGRLTLPAAEPRGPVGGNTDTAIRTEPRAPGRRPRDGPRAPSGLWATDSVGWKVGLARAGRGTRQFRRRPCAWCAVIARFLVKRKGRITALGRVFHAFTVKQHHQIYSEVK